MLNYFSQGNRFKDEYVDNFNFSVFLGQTNLHGKRKKKKQHIKLSKNNI